MSDASVMRAALGAIDLALTAGANDEASLAVIRAVLRAAPEGEFAGPEAAEMFVLAVADAGARFEVVDA